MGSDLNANPGEGFGSIVFDERPELEILVMGKEFRLPLTKFCLNSFGGTHLRGMEFRPGPIDNWALEADVFRGVANVEFFTHDHTGKHATIIKVYNLKDGDDVIEDVGVELNGNRYPFHVEMHFRVLQ